MKSGCIISLTLFFFLRMALVIQNLLWFYTNVRIVSSIFVKNTFVILMGMLVNLKMTLDSLDI